MTPAERLHAAALRIREVAAQATPGPWRDSSVDGNRYAALVSDVLPAGRPASGGWEDTEGDGGYLVGESLIAPDRAHIALWNPDVAVIVADVLDVLAEDVLAAHAQMGAALHLADIVLGHPQRGGAA